MEKEMLIMDSPSLENLSISQLEDKVFGNNLLLRIILSICEDPKTLRLVHPDWNDIILSSRKGRTRLSLLLPLGKKVEREVMGEDGSQFPPLDTIKNVDPRLVRNLHWDETQFATDSPAAMFQLRTFCTQFSGSIETLLLRIAEVTSLPPAAFLVMNTCPNLKELEIRIRVEDVFGYDYVDTFHCKWPKLNKTFVDGDFNPDGYLFNTLRTNFEPKNKLESLKFVDEQDYEGTLDVETVVGIRKVFQRKAQILLDHAPNLTRLFIATNFSLEAQSGLKEFTWELTLVGAGKGNIRTEHSDRDHGFSDIAAYYESPPQLLQSCADSLESLTIRFLGIQLDCQECQHSMALRHMPALNLPRLKKLVIYNPNCFTFDGGLGFGHFARKHLPSLETLEFGGHPKSNFKDLQDRLLELGRSCDDASIPVKTLDLGYINAKEDEKLVALSGRHFPNLTSLRFNVAKLDRREVSRFHFGKYLKSLLSKCGTIEGLEELRLDLHFLKVKCKLRHLTDALDGSGSFHLKSFRKLSLTFAPSQVEGTKDPRDHPKEAIAFGQCLAQTKHMAQVELHNLTIPAIILVPVLRTIDRLGLPVSFGNTELADRAMAEIRMDE